MNKVSLIIPVYNVEKYVRKCFESVVSQTFQDMEVLVIDNNSTDNSPQIIQEFAAKHPNFKTYKLVGGGLGGARNEGIRHASGEYLVFLDSDDYLKPNAIEELVKAAEENHADMAGCLTDWVDTQGNLVKQGFNKDMDFTVDARKDGKKKMLQIVGNMACPCLKIIKRTVITDNHLFFPENVPYEDVAYISTCSLLSNKYVQIPLPLWNYRYVPTSISNTKSALGPKSHFNNFALMRAFLQEKGLYTAEIAEEFEYRLLEMIIGSEEVGNGGLKRLPRERIEEFFRLSKEFYLNLPAGFFKNRNLIFRLKFKFFTFALKHNFYNMHKYTRVFFNLFSPLYRLCTQVHRG